MLFSAASAVLSYYAFGHVRLRVDIWLHPFKPSEISGNAYQLVQGLFGIANGGLLVTPHVVDGWTDPDGSVHEAEAPPAERIMREETAEPMIELLTNAIDNGIHSVGTKPSGSTMPLRDTFAVSFFVSITATAACPHSETKSRSRFSSRRHP